MAVYHILRRLVSAWAASRQSAADKVEVSVSVEKDDGGQREDEFTEIFGPGDKHERAFYRRLNEQREAGHFCDVAVVVEGRNFPAHRCVLAAQSDYFLGLFNQAFKEGQQKEVKVREISADAMEQVLTFLYTGSCSVNVWTAVEVLQAADMLLLADLKQRMVDYLANLLDLAKKLSPDSVLFMYRLGQKYNSDKLELAARDKIMTEFFVFAMTEDFLDMTKDELATFLTDNKRVIGGKKVTAESREELVFQSVLRWVQADSSREQHIKELMFNVRFPLMQASYVIDVVMKEPLIRAACPEFIDEAMEYQITEEGKRGDLQTSRTRPVLTVSDSVICALKQDGSRAHLACFVMKHNRWYELQTLCLQGGESVTCATTFGSGPALSLMVGTSSGRVYDVQVTQLVELSTRLPGNVACDKLVSVNGSKNVYALCSERNPSTGSIVSRMFSLSVEHSIDTASCEELPGLPFPLIQYEAVVQQQKIWVLGESADPGQAYKTLQCFDVSSSTWSDSVVPLTFLPKTPHVACLPIPASKSALCFPYKKSMLRFCERVAKWAEVRHFGLPSPSDTVDDYHIMLQQFGWHLLRKRPVNGQCPYLWQSMLRPGQDWHYKPSLPWDGCTIFFGTSQ
ncbi:KLHL29 [Branchiostoma lanceolatum]|uniref:KLHL29 protein n=1 Tax=Branchiostoma lanceolatum TaxID=7740 RepID=A0A8K0EQ87_BRALA|nr:KLHL29 [Branchiostoma lanceolatum]